MNDYLNTRISREEFIRTRGAIRTQKISITGLNLFDYFCKGMYQKEGDSVILEIAEAIKHDGNHERVFRLCNSFIQWLLEDHPDVIVQKYRHTEHIKKHHSRSIKGVISTLRAYIEEILEIKDIKPVKCVFCIDRDNVDEHGLWNFSAPADKIIKEYVTKIIGITECSHLQASDVTLEMSELLASVLCDYVLKHHIHFQNDNEFIEGISRDKELMIRLLDKYVQESLSFDQSKHNPKTAEWLMKKYQRYAEYNEFLKETIYF